MGPLKKPISCQAVLNYQVAVFCFAFLDVISTGFNIVAVYSAGLQWNNWQLLFLLLLVGPICGLFGAGHLKRSLVGGWVNEFCFLSFFPSMMGWWSQHLTTFIPTHLEMSWNRRLCGFLRGEGSDSSELCTLHLLLVDCLVRLSAMLDHQDRRYILVGFGQPHQRTATSSVGSQELRDAASLLVIYRTCVQGTAVCYWNFNLVMYSLRWNCEGLHILGTLKYGHGHG